MRAASAFDASISSLAICASRFMCSALSLAATACSVADLALGLPTLLRLSSVQFNSATFLRASSARFWDAATSSSGLWAHSAGPLPLLQSTRQVGLVATDAATTLRHRLDACLEEFPW